MTLLRHPVLPKTRIRPRDVWNGAGRDFAASLALMGGTLATMILTGLIVL